MERMRSARKMVLKVIGVCIIALFAFMTLIGTYQIVTRYFFNRPSTVSEELLTYSFTWMSLLAAAYVFGKRDHMRMGFLADQITGPARKIIEVLIDGLSFALAGVVMVYGGVAITASSTVAVHALSYPLGGTYRIPHGVSNATAETSWRPQRSPPLSASSSSRWRTP